MPHMHSEEYLVFERPHERQRQLKQQHQVSHQRKSNPNSRQRLMGSLGTFFVTIGTRMQHVARHSEHAV